MFYCISYCCFSVWKPTASTLPTTKSKLAPLAALSTICVCGISKPGLTWIFFFPGLGLQVNQQGFTISCIVPSHYGNPLVQRSLTTKGKLALLVALTTRWVHHRKRMAPYTFPRIHGKIHFVRRISTSLPTNAQASIASSVTTKSLVGTLETS